MSSKPVKRFCWEDIIIHDLCWRYPPEQILRLLDSDTRGRTMSSKPVKRFCSDLIIEKHTVLGIRAVADRFDIRSVVIPQRVLCIGDNTFEDCFQLTSVTFPNKLTTIGDSAFCNCRGLNSDTLPESLTHLGGAAFLSCSGLTSVTFPNKLTTVGARAFSHCHGLTSVTLPESLTHLGERAFSGCSGLTSVTLPNALTHVGEYAFAGCTALTSVVFRPPVSRGAFIAWDGEHAFAGCTALTSVVFGPPVSRGAFIAWATANSRHRDNWQLTTVKQLRNVLRLITTFAMWSRDVNDVDPGGRNDVFNGSLFGHRLEINKLNKWCMQRMQSEQVGKVNNQENNLFLDAENKQHFKGRYINDARHTKFRTNARLVADYTTNICTTTYYTWVKIFATRKIRAGEELLIDFGDDFWRTQADVTMCSMDHSLVTD